MSLISALVTRALDVDFSATSRSADAGRFVREAIGRIYRTTALARGEFEVAATVTVGNNTLAFAANAPRVNTVLDAQTGAELDEATREDLRSLQLARPQRGRPTAYALVGIGDTGENLSVMVWPTADRSYDFVAVGRFAPPTGDLDDADQCPLPTDYENLPVYYARAELFMLEDDDALHDKWRTKWLDGCKELRGDLQRVTTRNRVVPGTWARSSSSAPSFHYPGQL